MTEKLQKNKKTVNEDEIDLIALVHTLWKGRKRIIITVIIFAIIGLFIALLSPKEYTASTTMVPQLSNRSSKLSGLSSLAAMAGFNLDLNVETSDLSPYIYPQILQSVPFQLEIMNTPFTFSDIDHPVSIYKYYTEIYKPGILSSVAKYTIGLPGVIILAIRGNTQDTITSATKQGTLQLTQEQDNIRKIIAENVTLETNDKEGYVVLSSRFHEATLAAEVAQKGQELLQRYITEFKIEKATAQLEFIEARCDEKKKEFEKAQANLASFRDRNKNVTSAMARTEEERLQNEYQLAFNVYSELAKQLEQAQIKVKEDTPVFSIVKPVVVPIEKSSPNRPLILIVWTFLGGIIAIGWILSKQFFSRIKIQWEEEMQN